MQMKLQELEFSQKNSTKALPIVKSNVKLSEVRKL